MDKVKMDVRAELEVVMMASIDNYGEDWGEFQKLLHRLSVLRNWLEDNDQEGFTEFLRRWW